MSERAKDLLAKLTPRLLNTETAAQYCGVSAPHFLETVGKAVKPTRLGKRVLWDVHALDRWLDLQAGLDHPRPSNAEWLGALDADSRERD